MANPLTAVARGTANTIEAGAKRVAENVASTIPNPAKMAYSIGLGIGPLIQNIVKEINKEKKDGDNKVVKKLDESKRSQEKGQGKVTTEMSKMTAQLSMSNALLKEIRNLQIKQMAAAAKQNGLGNTGRMIRESDSRIQAATVASIAAPSSAPSNDGSGMSGIKTLLGLGLGGMAMGELWKLLPSDMKDSIKSGASSMVSGVASMWIDALKSSPELTLFGTYVGARLANKLLGLTDMAVGVAKTGMLAWKGASKISEAIVGGGAIAAPAASSAGTAAKAEGLTNAARRAAGMEQRVGGVSMSEAVKDYKSTSKMFGHVQGGAQVEAQMAAKYGAANIEAIKAAAAGGSAGASTAATTAAAGQVAGAGTEVGKAASTLSKVAGVASKALGVIGIGGSLYSGYNNAQAGNTKLAALDAFSAATGAAALTAGATGIGAPAAIALGAASIVSGVASAIGSHFVDNNSSSSSNVQPSSTATGQAQKQNVAGKWQDDKDFLTEVDRVSQKYQLNKQDLIALMQAESGTNIDPSIKNPNGSASGIIQFTEATAQALGTSTEKLRQMTRAQQMGYVDAYFEKWGLPKGASAGDLYTAIFKPSALRTGEETLYSRGTREYALNAGLDRDNDGTITRKDLSQQLARFGADTSRDSAGAGTAMASGSGSGSTSLTASSLTSQNAMMASSLAEAQTSWNAMSKAMFGQEIKIDMSKEINNILGSNAGQGGLAGLMTSNPSNPINKMAFAATGAGNQG